MADFDVMSWTRMSFEELEAECSIIDWRSSEEEVIESVAAFIHPDTGVLRWREDEACGGFLCWNGKEHKVPLTNTRHDRYVAISSVAHVLAEHYQFWLLKARLGGDTHSLLMLPLTES